MRRAACALAVMAAFGRVCDAADPDATDPAAAAGGKAIFERLCAPCHAAGPGIDGSPMLPGAAALEAKYKGAVSPVLEERGDLTASALRTFVRNGTGSMPMFRKTEISDAEIAAVAAYLAAASRAKAGASR